MQLHACTAAHSMWLWASQDSIWAPIVVLSRLAMPRYVPKACKLQSPVFCSVSADSHPILAICSTSEGWTPMGSCAHIRCGVHPGWGPCKCCPRAQGCCWVHVQTMRRAHPLCRLAITVSADVADLPTHLQLSVGGKALLCEWHGLRASLAKLCCMLVTV